MQQQLILSENEKVQMSAEIDEFNKQDDENGREQKRESEIESQPSTSTEDGISLPIVNGVIYNYKYISKVKDLPVKDMISSSVKRNVRLPKIYLTGRPFEISFLLDTDFISERDLWVDNLGSWAGTIRRPTCKSIRVNAAGVPDTKHPYYVIRKKYGSHPHSDPPLGLMKCLCYLTRDGRATGNALLSYKCLENCNLQPRPHGNNKHSQSPYVRTYPSTLLKIKERIGLQSPATIWNELSVDSTGNMDVQATVRDRKQVYNARTIRKKSPDPQTQDDINQLKLRVTVLEEQNSKLIFTNASLMELVNDLRKTKQELEAENRRIKQDSLQGRTNGLLLPHPTVLTYPGQLADKTRASIYEAGAETTVVVRDRCIEECRMQEPPTINQTTCFAAVPGHKY
uniref:BEN domain-containing protein n=1 Tax=Elaeophora elaphi TaxID=1147741 RepID=A0A0R3RXI1_9BILA